MTPDWHGKRVLVTGAGGFIGSHLTEAMVRAGADVRAFVHYNGRLDRGMLAFAELDRELDVRFGDITDPWSVDSAMRGVDVVFHLAALIGIPYSYVAPASYTAVNVNGTLNVLQAVRSHEIGRLVHTSTSEVYGTARYVPIDEQHPLQPQSPYSASKIAADSIAESFYRSFEAPVAIIRPFNTYGPRQSARAVIPTIASQLLAGLPELRLGSLTPERDLTFVADTVAAFMAVGSCDACIGNVTNVGNGRAISIGDLARMMAVLAGRPDVPIVGDDDRVRPDMSEVMQLVCDHSKATERAQWEPRTSLKDGLTQVMEFTERHISLYRPETYAQ
jgi:NAD dependent epimerase/dehydratase